MKTVVRNGIKIMTGVEGNEDRVFAGGSNGQMYRVDLGDAEGRGKHCDCKSFQHQHREKGTDCKHLASLRAAAEDAARAGFPLEAA